MPSEKQSTQFEAADDELYYTFLFLKSAKFHPRFVKQYALGLQILLAVDTTLQDDRLDIKAFVSRQLVLKDKPVATEFRPVDCEVRSAELEKLGGETTIFNSL